MLNFPYNVKSSIYFFTLTKTTEKNSVLLMRNNGRNKITFILLFDPVSKYCETKDVQGYPLEMRLQRRVYGIYIVNGSLFPATVNLYFSLSNH